MKFEKAIVVLAYNRFKALNNLLLSLNQIKCKENILLIISIDNNGTDEVNKLAADYQWRFGPKKVIIHQKRLGLKAQFILAGDLTEDYENIIFLEDDLVVSPYLIDFCNAYLNKYWEDDRIAGASLYNPILKEGSGCKFFQVEDGFDNYFLQQPYWGNVWSRNKWSYFKTWLEKYEYNEELLPKHIAEWRDTSFKKVFVQYLIETNRYFVTPRLSLVSNNGEAGIHNTSSKYQYQCNLQVGEREYQLGSIDESLSIYDAFFEVLPSIIKKLNPRLESYDFYVDIYKQKPIMKKYRFCLTTRICSNPVISFNGEMKPKELGVILNAQGEGISLYKTEDLIDKNNDRSILLADDMMDNYLIDFKAALLILKRKVKDKLKIGG